MNNFLRKYAAKILREAADKIDAGTCESKEYEEDYPERAYRHDHEEPDYDERINGRYGYRRRMR